MEVEFFEPATIAEALALGGRWGERGCFVAGGTDLVIQMRRGRRDPQALISLLGVRELHGIDVADEGITLGASTTHREIERHPAFEGALYALVEGAQVIGGHQVRNVATIAGNVCNASPAADLAPVLLTLEADVHVATSEGARRIPLSQFLQGPGRTALAPGELVTAISFDRPPPRTGTSFLKFGRRQAMEISIVSVAALVTLDEDGRRTCARIAVGAAAPTAMRIPDAERLLAGSMDAGAAGEAARLAARAVSPLSDVRASAEYRRQLVGALVPRALAIAQRRAQRT